MEIVTLPVNSYHLQDIASYRNVLLRPRQENFLPDAAFLFNEDSESVEKKKI